jgi:hypothetical protein
MQQVLGAATLRACCHHPLPCLLLCAAAETQDAEEAQACVLVTLVVLAKGTVRLPEQPLRSQQAFKECMKSVSVFAAHGCWGQGRGRGREASGGGEARGLLVMAVVEWKHI